MPVTAWVLAVCLIAGSRSPAVPARSADADSGLPPIRVGPILLAGYVQFDGVFPLGADAAASPGTFRVRRARVYASGDVLPKIGFMINADIADSSVMRDVYVTFRPLDAANIRAGQFIAPYSLERLTSTRDLEAIDRAVDRFVPSRDMGVEVFNATPFRRVLSYAAAVVNGTGQNARDNNNAKDVVGRIVVRVPAVRRLSIGVNGARGRQPTGMRTRWGGDLDFERDEYRIAAEYVHETRDQWRGLSAHGFYVLARRRFRLAASPARFPMAEAVARLAEIRDPAEITAGVPGIRRREAQFGGNYYFSPNVRLMADAVVPTARLAGSPRATLVTRVQFSF